MSKSVKQHWVPRFYLREFATPETKEAKKPKVWAFHKDEGDPFLVNVEDIAAKRHLYTPSSPEGKRDWTIDDMLTDLEGLVSRIWPRVSNGFVDLSDVHIRKGLSLFVSTLILRHPSNIDEVKKIHAQMVALLEGAPKDEKGAPVGSLLIGDKEIEIDNLGWEEYKNTTEYGHSRFFTGLIKSEGRYIAEILMKKRWSVVTSDLPVFITTDNPVVLDHPDKEKGKFGIGSEGTIITFPLSPTRTLIMDDLFNEPSSQYYQLRENTPAVINQLLWSQTYRFMISPRDPAGVLKEIIDFGETLEKEHSL